MELENDTKSDMAKLKRAHDILQNFPRYEAYSANGKRVDDEVYKAFVSTHKAMDALSKYEKQDLPKMKNEKIINGVKSECKKVEQDLKKIQTYILEQFGDQDPTAKALYTAINYVRRNLMSAANVANGKESQKISQALQKAVSDIEKIKKEASKQDDKKLDGYLKDASDNIRDAQRIAKKPFFNSKETIPKFKPTAY